MWNRLAWFALLAGGCTTVDSSDILTSGMYASISASADGTGTTDVSATLYLGNPINLNFVDLTGNDELIASHAGQDKVMTEIIVLNIVMHHATFPVDAEGSLFEVAFLRTVDPGAPSSTATLPAPLVVNPIPNGTASRAAPLVLTWSPPATDAMSWSASGNCIDSASGTISDTGALTLPAGSLQKRMDPMTADSCVVTLSLTRSRPGVLDPGYGKGGQVEGKQTRSIMFTTTP